MKQEDSMPDREVQTIRDLIFYQYAKIIAKAALGPDAKKSAYGFIKTKFRELRDNREKWSDILREDKELVNSEKVCAYCRGTLDRDGSSKPDGTKLDVFDLDLT
jgi:hypothetical protein